MSKFYQISAQIHNPQLKHEGRLNKPMANTLNKIKIYKTTTNNTSKCKVLANEYKIEHQFSCITVNSIILGRKKRG